MGGGIKKLNGGNGREEHREDESELGFEKDRLKRKETGFLGFGFSDLGFSSFRKV